MKTTIHRGFSERLAKATQRHNSLVCCGLDPDITRMPCELSGVPQQRIGTFLKTVIELSRADVCAYKIQKAFFDSLDGGKQLLKEIVTFIRSASPETPIILDCKIGDVEHTMAAYLRTIFNDLGADAVVMNPYMGPDVWKSLPAFEDRAALILVRTSNPGSTAFQMLPTSDGIQLWERVLTSLVHDWQLGYELIPIMASTSGDDTLSRVRTLIPDDMPIFVAGIGAQGGDLSSIRPALNSCGSGVLVNSSRGLLYPFDPENTNWRSAISEATSGLKRQLNELRI